MINAYRSYAYLLTPITDEALATIKSLFQDCVIEQVPEVVYYSEFTGTSYLYLIRIGENGRFVKPADQDAYDIEMYIPVGSISAAAELTRTDAYDINLRNCPNVRFTILAH